MKFLLIALLLCVVGAVRSTDSDEDYYQRYDYNTEREPVPEEAISEEEYYNRYYGEGEPAADESIYDDDRYYGGYDGYDRYYTRRPRTEGRAIMRDVFYVNQGDINDIVETEETEEGRKIVWTSGVVEAVNNDVIPELCYLNSQNITIYNSFLLDRTCLEALEGVSPECRGFKCDLAHYFLEHGAQAFVDFFDAETIKDVVGVVHRVLSTGFEKLNMCTCGREFFKAVFKCSPYYNANALFALTDNDEDTIVAYGKIMRNVDVKAASKIIDRLMTGMCADSSSGMCLNSIFNGLEELAEMVTNTIEDWDDYDDGDRKFQRSQEKRCDAVFSPIRAWTKDDRDLDYYDGEDMWELIFNKTAAVTKAFYCEKRCKKDASRSTMYPCCMRNMLEDDKLYNNVEKLIESIYKVIPAASYDFEWEGFYELDEYFYRYSYSREELEDIMAWKMPKRIRDAFMRTVHAAKYCEGKILRCSK